MPCGATLRKGSAAGPKRPPVGSRESGPEFRTAAVAERARLSPTRPRRTSLVDYQIVGAIGSPYSRKLRAVLRYRRIPHVWIHQGTPEAAGLPQPRVALLPQLVLASADGGREALVDSTPLIRLLEARHPDQRPVIPADPALAFLDALVEDFADEWLTKAMFHYRWTGASDIEKASRILPRWAGSQQPDERLEKAGRHFAARQIGRLAVVGSNPTTAPAIERSFVRLVEVLERHLAHHRFVFGARPGAGDFGLFGQLTQLALFDPTPMAIVLERAPRVFAWTDWVDDLSGLEPAPGDWLDRDALPETFRALVTEIGRVYAPFLLANAAALERGLASVDGEIDGAAWQQAPFPYQGKCLAALRNAYRALSASDRSAVDRALAGSGCESLFA
ncbi:glutathione S-transferase C-terminal domain-containing protein [Myxococcota bacterium]|nr:glutathione S-transferase C-terminal domain-containing protein [Myxococcota bacterium]